MIPTARVLEKLDTLLSKKDYDAAERHLEYWLGECAVTGDLRGKLTLLNEKIGFYRKTEREKECLEAVAEAMALIATKEFAGLITEGTTLLNAATGLKAFGKTDEALALYREAEKIYEDLLEVSDKRMGGLYNNMAVALMEKGEFKEAEKAFLKALFVMEANENSELEQAITYCNLADMIVSSKGAEKSDEFVEDYLQKAEILFDAPNIPHDAYYAFVCEKCAPVFGYYGFFLTKKKLEERAKEFYERS